MKFIFNPFFIFFVVCSGAGGLSVNGRGLEMDTEGSSQVY
jgi:hypothetical protein